MVFSYYRHCGKSIKACGYYEKTKVCSRQAHTRKAINYMTIIRPILQYGCILFDNCNIQEMELLDSVQYDAARVCTGAICNTNKEKLLNELGWQKLSTRRQFHKLVMFYKIKNDLVPPYLQQVPLDPISNLSPYNTRNSFRVRPLRARTNKYKNSFFPSSAFCYCVE